MSSTVVVAQGVFDILHPGHLHYLQESSLLGDELHVIIAKREHITHKDIPVLPNKQRREMVAGLDPVDVALAGDEENIFKPIIEIDPDIITIGYDQDYKPKELESKLAERDVSCSVERISEYQASGESMRLSSSAIVEKILSERVA